MMAMSSVRPSIGEDLEVNEVKDGLIVFDPKTALVHYLNATAAVVFTLCDGRLDAPSIADFIAAAFDLDEPPLSEVEGCLAALGTKGLVH
jgi:hypothetical protein